jgi:hypothetical protein
MIRRFVSIAIVAGVVASVAAPVTALSPGSCPSDSKLLNGGPTRVAGQGPGTWWGLVISGLVAAGLDQEQDQIDYLNSLFGTHFTDLADLQAFNIQQVSDFWDKNQNGFVCAFELRGTRAYIGDPLVNLTFFGISDDRVPKG